MIEKQEQLTADATASWEREWAEAAAVERSEAPGHRFPALLGVLLVSAAVIAGLLPAIFPLSPGYRSGSTTAQVVAAAIAAAVAVGIVPLTSLLVRALSRHGLLLFGVAVLSAGAAAIHLAVAKNHFREYFLFGLFFVLSGLAQLAWAVLILFEPSRPLLALGAIGNLLIVAVWVVDRIWGLPIGPEHWTPEPVGFADVAASTFEVLVALGSIALLARAGRLGRPRGQRAVAVALTLLTIVVTTTGLLSAVGTGAPLITPSG